MYKDLGLVAQVFNEATLATLQGDLAIGHTRYSTTGSTTWDNAQPVFKNDGVRALALGPQRQPREHRRAASTGWALLGAATTDSDLVATMLASEMAHARPRGRRHAVLPELEGAFCFVIMDERSVFAARDPHGLRPLALGKLPQGFVRRLRDVRPRHRRRHVHPRGRAGRAGPDRRPWAALGPVRPEPARRALHLRVRVPVPRRTPG